MLERFQGDSQKANLREALLEQQCIAHKEAVVDKLMSVVGLQEFAPGSIIMQQGGQDRDLYFVLAGRVSIQVNGRELALRGAGQHIGEMALIDPRAIRSASILAVDPTVTARIAEQDFTPLAAEFPELWRRLALELANRLRERAQFVKAPNPRPVIFIGSSVESLQIANEIQAGLAHDAVVPVVWTNNVFVPGHHSMEDLELRISTADFGVFVCGQDDKIVNEQRHLDEYAPRDNVIFELGMSVGALGRRRTFVVKPRLRDLHLPSDLLGITPLDYTADDPLNIVAHVAPVCTAIRRVITDMGPK